MAKNEDLATLATIEQLLELKPGRLRQMLQRRRDGRRVDMPEPAIESSDGVTLWSVSEFTSWWPKRVDGRRLAGRDRAESTAKERTK